MALLAPQPARRHTVPRLGPWWRLVLFAVLGVMVAAGAQAQVVVGGNRAPSVSVDLTVLDGLGPAPTLPQLFGASRNGGAYAPAQTIATPPAARISAPAVHRPSTKSASATKRAKTHRVVHRKSTGRARLAHAPAPQPSVAAASSKANLHLIPPGTQTVSTTRATRDQPMIAQPIRASSVAITPPAPAPMPKLPQAAEVPAPPVLPSAPAHEEAPTAPPPSQARDDAAPMSLMAAQPSVGQTTEPDTRAVPKPPAPAATNSVPAPAPVQVASAPAAVSAPSTIKFAPGLTDLPPSSQPVLDTVAARLIASDALRVQLVARATGGADQAMEARRISLARAVAVRAYLIDKGVPRLRMDVRALGNRADDGPVNDQVDLLIVSQ